MAPNHLALKKEFVTWLLACWNLGGMAITQGRDEKEAGGLPCTPTPSKLCARCALHLTFLCHLFSRLLE